MNNNNKLNRRNFVKLSTGIISSIVVSTSKIAVSQDQPELIELTENDPIAKSLGYKVDANTVDIAAYATFDPTQLCSSCLHYQGKEGDSSGPCAMFYGKSVTADGWCSVYAPIPT